MFHKIFSFIFVLSCFQANVLTNAIGGGATPQVALKGKMQQKNPVQLNFARPIGLNNFQRPISVITTEKMHPLEALKHVQESRIIGQPVFINSTPVQKSLDMNNPAIANLLKKVSRVAKQLRFDRCMERFNNLNVCNGAGMWFVWAKLQADRLLKGY